MGYKQTIEKLNEMKLYGMTQSFSDRRILPDHKDLSFDQFMGLVVDDEYIHRKNNRLKRLLKCAKFKIYSACLEDLDYKNSRGLIKSKVLNLQNPEWIQNHQNILITGPTGVGKTYLACAFGNYACRQGFTALYYRWPRLFGDILASIGVKFPMYSSRYKNMTTSNIVPIGVTIETFGDPPYSLEDGVQETVQWMEMEGDI